jgi:tRNA pseudouridine55 synthase
LDNSEKEYVFTVRLDGKSESFDQGTLVEKIDTQKILQRTDREIIDFLLSQKKQVPPKYSALHIEGNRAYDLARK